MKFKIKLLVLVAISIFALQKTTFANRYRVTMPDDILIPGTPQHVFNICVSSYNDTIVAYKSPSSSQGMWMDPAANFVGYKDSVYVLAADTGDWIYNGYYNGGWHGNIVWIFMSPYIPTITVNNATICSGNTATLTASGAATYLWNTGATNNSYSVSPTSTTTYKVTGTSSAYGCTNTTQAVVTVNPLPIAEAGNNQSICFGSSATLTASSCNFYNWSNGSTTQTTSVSPTSNTAYFVTVIDNNGCENTDNVSITVNPLPTAEAGSNQSICFGSSATLTASSCNFYNWSNGATTQTTSVLPTSNTTYFLTVTNNNGCKNTDNISIIVNSLPTTPTITQNGDTLISSSATGNQWHEKTSGIIGGATNQKYSPIQTGNYFVIITDVYGCISDSSNIIAFIHTGVIENKINDFKIYPNPATSQITLETNTINNVQLTICNLSGQELIKQQAKSGKQEVDVSVLPSGVYFVKILHSNTIKVEKIIIQ